MQHEKLQLRLENATLANRAMGSVLLLYYHLLREGGITNDQTIHVNVEDFHPFRYLSVEVSDELVGADQSLLREGAIIYLLCDLSDLVGEHNSDYLKQPLVQRILSALSSIHGTFFPEAGAIARMLSAGESELNYQDLAVRLAQVYQRYVVSRFGALVACAA